MPYREPGQTPHSDPFGYGGDEDQESVDVPKKQMNDVYHPKQSGAEAVLHGQYQAVDDADSDDDQPLHRIPDGKEPSYDPTEELDAKLDRETSASRKSAKVTDDEEVDDEDSETYKYKPGRTVTQEGDYDHEGSSTNYKVPDYNKRVPSE